MDQISVRGGGSMPFRDSGRGTRGFSLVEILVVITIMALLVGLVASSASSILENANVTACQSNLKDIAQNMIIMKGDRRKKGKSGFPKAKGIRFLLELTKGGKFAYITGKKTKVFICPGTDDTNFMEGDDRPGSAYLDMDKLDSISISYAGRNQIDFPLERDRNGEDAVLAADDNEGGRL
jgi:prepilin-type N-terminal cleavage/methylation domain-containing protein